MDRAPAGGARRTAKESGRAVAGSGQRGRDPLVGKWGAMSVCPTATTWAVLSGLEPFEGFLLSVCLCRAHAEEQAEGFCLEVLRAGAGPGSAGAAAVGPPGLLRLGLLVACKDYSSARGRAAAQSD